MQELIGRLTALDPEASEGVKVISYFDALVVGHASFEVLLRGAAILSGCAAGFVAGRHAIAVDAKGTHLSAPVVPQPGRWFEHAVLNGGRAWLERDGRPHANDEMILERLSIAIGITIERSTPISARRRAVETIIDSAESLEKRRVACARLQLNLNERFVVVAEPARTPNANGHYTIVATTAGTVRATILREGDTFAAKARAGVGIATIPDSLDQSWVSALAALRLTSTGEPVLRACDVGGLTLLAVATDASGKHHPDLSALKRVIDDAPRTLEVIEALVNTESLRAAAAKVGLHHSTIQARATDLSLSLGYEIPTAAGRTRLAIALSLYRLSTNRFS